MSPSQLDALVVLTEIFVQGMVFVRMGFVNAVKGSWDSIVPAPIAPGFAHCVENVLTMPVFANLTGLAPPVI